MWGQFRKVKTRYVMRFQRSRFSKSKDQAPKANSMSSISYAMNLLSRRDHSAKELKTKLARRYEPAEIAEALEYVTTHRWLKEEGELAEQVAGSLHRKHKGILFINNYLQKKGLPTVDVDDELEFEKALAMLKRLKTRKSEPAKLARALASRGFTSSIIRKALYAKL